MLHSGDEDRKESSEKEYSYVQSYEPDSDSDN